MDFTPFDLRRPGKDFLAGLGFGVIDDIEWFSDRGIRMTNTPFLADIFVMSKYPRISRIARIFLRVFRWKPALIWTDEPRNIRCLSNSIPPQHGIPRLHIMSVYTGDIFVTNYAVYGWAIHQRLPEIVASEVPETFNNGRCAVAIATYRGDPFRQRFVDDDGRDIDLVIARQELILAGHKMGLVDVFGRGWPDGIASGESRGGAWYESKLEIMRNYNFNICLENTNFPYYCTEKIWDSIRTNCLPIYYGSGNRIYDDFPKNSFLDYAEFDNPENLFKYIREMDKEDYCMRMNRCIQTFNSIYERGGFLKARETLLNNIVDKLTVLARRK